MGCKEGGNGGGSPPAGDDNSESEDDNSGSGDKNPNPGPSGPGPKLSAELQQVVKSASALQSDPKIDFSDPTSDSNPANVKRVMALFPEKTFNKMFPIRLPVYTWKGFIQAAARYPSFCGEKSSASKDSLDQTCKRELAAFFAHSTQETGAHDKYLASTKGIPQWRQSFRYSREIGCKSTPQNFTSYNSSCHSALHGTSFPCPPSALQNKIVYCGRGPLQISHNYNYGAFSLSISGNSKILNSPDTIATNPTL